MSIKEMAPGAPGSARRANNTVALGSNSDPQTDTSTVHETLAVQLLADRLGRSIATARVIWELAGIGGVK